MNSVSCSPPELLSYSNRLGVQQGAGQRVHPPRGMASGRHSFPDPSFRPLAASSLRLGYCQEHLVSVTVVVIEPG